MDFAPIRSLFAPNDFKCQYQGALLPLLKDTERDWPNILRLVLYLMGLGYMFLGVAVISDVFMNGIEKITSAKKRVTNKKTGKTVTVYVWNATVANLTLMALGSSAPEILLSLIEISSDEFFLGPLGSGTIVGSAAFNLLVISAVCVAAIPELPDGSYQVRFIKEVPVYVVTATTSVFAYIWLLIMLMGISPDVCELWEGVVTLLMCPAFVFASYLADRGYFSKKDDTDFEDLDGVDDNNNETLSDDATPEELARIEEKIRSQHGLGLTDEQVIQIMREQYFQKHSRAWYRHQAMQAKLHGHHVDRTSIAPMNHRISCVVGTSDDIKAEKKLKSVVMGVASTHYRFLENIGKAPIVIVRSGPLHCVATVKYITIADTAKKGEDFEHAEGTCTFQKGETTQTIYISIMDDAKCEQDETFSVELSDPAVEDTASCIAIIDDDSKSCSVVIIDDDHPGQIRFLKEEIEFNEEHEDHEEQILVERYGGARGKIGCQYATDAMKATEGVDFEATKGYLELADGQTSTTIPIMIKGRSRNAAATFNLVLKEPTDTKFDAQTDGGEETCICHIVIVHRNKENMFSGMIEKIHSANTIAGHKNWGQQFHDAVFDLGNGDDDEEEEELQEGDVPSAKEPPGKIDIFMHVISVPWKLLFAFVPPVDYCGGWACFMCALVFIGGVTWLVGDMANLVGCCFDILPETAAITFVALGTSLPDTFASKTAAMMDPYADASIGNVTGSNAVNVFLGMGISWTMAAFLWETSEQTPEWLKRTMQHPCSVQENVAKRVELGSKAVFVTPAGTIYINLIIFCINAFFALQHLFARRKKWGGELGGPKKGIMGQYFSATFLIAQWFIYVILSTIFARLNDGVTYTALAATDTLPTICPAPR